MLGVCGIQSMVYQDVCQLCKVDDKVSRYVGETSRTMVERTAEHQRNALGLSKRHMKDHTRTHHPNSMDKGVESFTMHAIKPCRSALSRQVREAVEISQDSFHCLLNSKDEYNRCLLPSISVAGPPSIREQEEEAERISRDMLSPEEEEEAMRRARQAHKKRLRETQDVKTRHSKRVKLNWL